ncbi:hypothetical protein PBI_PAEDORE_72 [Streptomyces phage Paedore]|uniref:DUF7417 domain-containing protein n=1 Tax=Streptomyces phage Paedore TaxID=2108134 RepID=A0A2P1JTT6_9CAUD|nr:hypothetical protein KGG91_gp72 [Streptomyces phage Paedore]AVO22555.1 hypothetical protein PBI_PAEDORE_72 [Streptomyces phage Paedore]
MKELAIDLTTHDAGELNQRETLELFDTLITSGMVWTLEVRHARTALWMINEGWILPFGGITKLGDQMLEAVA